MTREEIYVYEKISEQLLSFHKETTVLVKKDPKSEMNIFKLKLINSVLEKANVILKDLKPFEDFESFDIDELPNNGDVVLVLGQYINCMEQLRKNNAYMYNGLWYWKIDEKTEGEKIITYLPKKYL